MSTIDDKLTQLNTVKGRLMSVINGKLNNDDPKINSSTPFSEYVDFIDTYLTRVQVVTYTVTFKNGTSTVRTDSGKSAGTEITTPGKPADPTGYTITGDGWYDGNTRVCEFNGTYTVTGNKTLKTKLTANEYPVTLNYGWDGTQNTDTVTVNGVYGTTPTLNGTFGLQTTDLEVSGYNYTVPTFNPVSNITAQNIYNVSYTAAETYYYFLGNENPTDINQFNSFSTSETMATVSQGASSYQYLYVIIPSSKHLRINIMSGIESTMCDTGCDNTIKECPLCDITGTPTGYKVLAYYSVNPITQNTGDYTKIIIQQ